MRLRQINEIVILQKPRRISISWDDWAELESEINPGPRRNEHGQFQSGLNNTNRDPLVSYTQGDDYAYVMGVLVSRSIELKRGETKVEQ